MVRPIDPDQPRVCVAVLKHTLKMHFMCQADAAHEVLPVMQEVAPADMPVGVALVWKPLWSPAVMRDAAREVLRWPVH